MNYTELETAIQDYCQTSETTFVNNINNFIKACEDKIFMAMDGTISYNTTTAGIATVSGTTIYSTDDGTIDIQAIRLNETASEGVDAGGPIRYLQEKTPEYLEEAYPGATLARETGIPKYYSVLRATLNSSEPILRFKLAPTPDDIYNMDMSLQKKAAADSITNGNTPGGAATTTTWLSITFPDVLLYGSLVQAYVFMKGDADVMQMYEKQYADGMLLLKNLTERRQLGDKYRDDKAPEGQGQ